MDKAAERSRRPTIRPSPKVSAMLVGRIAREEDSPSGLWRTLGKRVGCKPSGVRIPHPPPYSSYVAPGHGMTGAVCCRSIWLLWEWLRLCRLPTKHYEPLKIPRPMSSRTAGSTSACTSPTGSPRIWATASHKEPRGSSPSHAPTTPATEPVT